MSNNVWPIAPVATGWIDGGVARIATPKRIMTQFHFTAFFQVAKGNIACEYQSTLAGGISGTAYRSEFVNVLTCPYQMFEIVLAKD